MIRFLLFRWKQLLPFSSIQRVFIENFKENRNTPCPFDFNIFNPMAEIDIIKAKIIDYKPSLAWSKDECDLPDDLSDEDLGELYVRYNHMLLNKIKKNVYKH